MTTTNRGFVTRLGEMFQHQVGGEFRYPTRAQRLVRVPQGVNSHRRQAFD
jgi:hypothetical protein